MIMTLNVLAKVPALFVFIDLRKTLIVKCSTSSKNSVLQLSFFLVQAVKENDENIG